MRMVNIGRKIYRLFMGEYKSAVKNGLKVGKGITVMAGTKFGSEPYLITLGDRVRISSDVRFVTHDGGTWAFRREEGYEKVVCFGKIAVGDDTFIGMGAIIMPGITIGKNCVIGAGSIVTMDIPDGTVAAGVPAKVICTTDEYAEKCRQKMPENFDFDAYNRNKREYLTEIL